MRPTQQHSCCPPLRKDRQDRVSGRDTTHGYAASPAGTGRSAAPTPTTTMPEQRTPVKIPARARQHTHGATVCQTPNDSKPGGHSHRTAFPDRRAKLPPGRAIGAYRIRFAGWLEQHVNHARRTVSPCKSGHLPWRRMLRIVASTHTLDHSRAVSPRPDSLQPMQSRWWRDPTVLFNCLPDAL